MYDPSMRVLTVLELLQARESVTGAELARRLEVSARTVQRYVARLVDLGVPVESRRGVGGAYFLRPGFRLPPLMFTDDEALALALGLRALDTLGLRALAPAAEGAGAKLARVLPRAVGERVRDVEEAVQFEAWPWTVATDARAVLAALGAARAGRVIAFGYRSHAGAETRRRVAPYGVVHADGRWYLVGRCLDRDALRTFRLDRASRVEETPEPFTRPEGFDARAHLHETLPFVREEHEIDVWIDRPPEAVRAEWTAAQVRVEPEGTGARLLCTRDHLEPFAAKLLAFGARVEVRRPEALRAVFSVLAARAAEAARGA